MDKIKKILIIRLRKIGDIVLTTPVLTAVKQLFQTAKIDYIVEAPFGELIENHPLIDTPIIINRNDSILKIRKIFKDKKYDILYDMHGGPRASTISLLVKAKIKVGYNHPYRGFIYDFKINRHFTSPIHSVENQLNLVRVTGFKEKTPEDIILPPIDEYIEKKIEQRISKTENNRIVLHIGAGNRFRDWGENRYKELIRLLINDKIVPVLTGGKDAMERGKRYENEFGNKIINLTAKASLTELRYIIKKSLLFFGVDSGPMHIAAATNTPIIAIFGPNIPAISGPWRKKDIYIIEKNLDCRPCSQRKCIYGDIRCQSTITVEEVYNKIKEVIGEKSVR